MSAALSRATVAPHRFVVEVPVHTKNKNARELPFVKAKRVKEERRITRLVLNARSVRCPFEPPLDVTLTRISAGHMDDDNVVGALAHVRDEVAAWIGIDDRHRHLVRYLCEAEKGPRGTHGVRIEVAPRVQPEPSTGLQEGRKACRDVG